MIDIATVAVIALPSATIGAFLAYTLLPGKGEGSPNVCGDALTIERLTAELSDWQKSANNLGRLCLQTNHKRQVALTELAALRAENRDLHIDIAEKAKRLSDAGLQSAGGEA